MCAAGSGERRRSLEALQPWNRLRFARTSRGGHDGSGDAGRADHLRLSRSREGDEGVAGVHHRRRLRLASPTRGGRRRLRRASAVGTWRRQRRVLESRRASYRRGTSHSAAAARHGTARQPCADCGRSSGEGIRPGPRRWNRVTASGTVGGNSGKGVAPSGGDCPAELPRTADAVQPGVRCAASAGTPAAGLSAQPFSAGTPVPAGSPFRGTAVRPGGGG